MSKIFLGDIADESARLLEKYLKKYIDKYFCCIHQEFFWQRFSLILDVVLNKPCVPHLMWLWFYNMR